MRAMRILLGLSALALGTGAARAQDPAAAADGCPGTAVELRVADRPGGRFLEVHGGEPGARGVLLLGGPRAPTAGGPCSGLDLRAAAVRAFVLDADGSFEHALPPDLQGGLARAQVWLTGLGLSRATALGEMPGYSGPSFFQRGTVLITEFMKDPSSVSDASGEWIELYNPAPGRINLEGMVLSDGGSNSHTIDNNGNGLFLRPGRYMVLGSNDTPATNGGIPVRYRWSGFTLANGADSIILTAANGALMDRVDYDDGVLWPDSPGMSISLDPAVTDALANDDPANWCHSTTPISVANPDTGTPRAPNDVCP